MKSKNEIRQGGFKFSRRKDVIEEANKIIRELRKENSRLKEGGLRKDVKVIKCCWCERIIGYRIGYQYFVNEGVIQWGTGRGKELKSFCDKKCSEKYRAFINRLDKINMRLAKLETK